MSSVSTPTPGSYLPSSADLDAVAEEQAAAESTSKPLITPALPNFQPYFDRLLVRRVDLSAATSANYGMIVPDAAKEKPLYCDVVAVGQGRLLEDGTLAPLVTKVGDRVLVGKYSGAGAEVKLAGVEYCVVREDEVLGRVTI